MNKKGFTLIELLAVLAILAVIALIAFPAMDSTLKSGREKLSAAQEKQIINGAKSFFADNVYCLPGSNSSKCKIDSSKCSTYNVINSNKIEIGVVCLQNLGYLPANIVDFNKDDDGSDRNYSSTTVVEVTKNYENYDYRVVVK